MRSIPGLPSREELARAVLRGRGEAASFMKEAQDAGRHKEAKQWESELRKVDKLIAQYGLNRYAPVTGQ